MSYDSIFTQIGDNEEFDQSVNPISTPTASLDIPIANDTSNNRDDRLGRLPLLRGHFGLENVEIDPDRSRPFKECLALERTSAASCIWIPNHPGIFHFRNRMG